MDKIIDSIIELREDEANESARKYLDQGGEPGDLIDACRDAMNVIGEKYETGEYFLSELLLSGEIFSSIMEYTLPLLKDEGGASKIGKMVLGTVKNDIHDIGKNTFKAFAEAAGFEIIDIGIDTPEEKFVEAIREHNPDIVGLSCLITAGIDSMKKTVDAIRDAGFTDTKIVIGGGRSDQDTKEYTGADAWADDAGRGVRLLKELMGMEG